MSNLVEPAQPLPLHEPLDKPPSSALVSANEATKFVPCQQFLGDHPVNRPALEPGPKRSRSKADSPFTQPFVGGCPGPGDCREPQASLLPSPGRWRHLVLFDPSAPRDPAACC